MLLQSCGTDGDLLSPPARPLFSVTCPPGISGCVALDSADVANILNLLDEIDEEATYWSATGCGFVRDKIEELLYADPPRLSKKNLGSAGYTGLSNEGNDTILLNSYFMTDPYEMFWTLVHEPRHLRGESHYGNEDGYFEHETNFISRGCTDFDMDLS